MVFIGVTTVAAGLVQLVAPGFVLSVLDSERTDASRHFFAIVGMFMAVIGGGLTSAMFLPGDHRVLMLWAGVQKFGAFAAVSLGVQRGIFSGIAILVAVNDLGSSAVIFWYRRRL
jgi:hypothetical protein